jgi:16S rRNA G966 N2-methylase RsmD
MMQVGLTQEELEFVAQHKGADVPSLALRMRQYPTLDAKKVLDQLSGMRDAAVKIPTWSDNPNILYPTKLSMEQCSSESTARYKSQLLNRLDRVQSLVDLTGGFGVDFYFMSHDLPKAVYVEKNTALFECVRHNVAQLGFNQAECLNQDGVEWLHDQSTVFDLVYLDPARRNAHGGKVVALSDCEPNVVDIKDQLFEKGRFVMIKMSPMLDIRAALRQLPETIQIHIVAVENECKELLFILDKNRIEGPIRLFAAQLRQNHEDTIFEFTLDEEASARPVYATQLKSYLYEPNAALLKSGAFNVLSVRHQVEKLHPNTHLYTSDRLIPDFPGRAFEITTHFSVQSKEVKQVLGKQPKANLTVRNFPESVDALRKRLGIQDGGNIYLFATTWANEKKVMIACEKIKIR